MILKNIFTILLITVAGTIFASSPVSIAGQAEPKHGMHHQKEELTIARLTPINSHHKNTITLSNGVKYKIYPFHGWDLEHWKVGQSVVIEKSQDLLYKVKIRNLSTDDTISAKRKAVLR